MATESATNQKSPQIIDVYKDLSFIKNKSVKFNSNAPFIPVYVVSQLTQSSDPAGMYASRVQGRQMLLENPARESRAKKQLDEKRAKQKIEKEKKRRGLISKREAKEKGVWRFDEAQAKFDFFIPLHHLWMGYMSELLSLPQRQSSSTPEAQQIPASSSMYPKLVKADFHGSLITVRQSKNPCLIGLSGIVIHETENVFKVITPKDKVKVIPKENSIFAFAVPLYSTLPPSYTQDQPLPLPDPEVAQTTVLQAPHIEFVLYGNQFRFRAADRAGRKFKHKETIEL